MGIKKLQFYGAPKRTSAEKQHLRLSRGNEIKLSIEINKVLLTCDKLLRRVQVENLFHERWKLYIRPTQNGNATT